LQPVYATLSSSGSTRWFQVDWWRNPQPLGISVAITTNNSSASGTYQIDVTIDDPTGFYPNPALNPGNAQFSPNGLGGKTVTVFQSSAIGGPTANSSVNFIGTLTTPIAAWRLTQNSTSNVTVATVLQPGPR